MKARCRVGGPHRHFAGIDKGAPVENSSDFVNRQAPPWKTVFYRERKRVCASVLVEVCRVEVPRASLGVALCKATEERLTEHSHVARQNEETQRFARGVVFVKKRSQGLEHRFLVSGALCKMSMWHDTRGDSARRGAPQDACAFDV
jgi:hypothetical protein